MRNISAHVCVCRLCVCVTENEYEDDESIREESGASGAPRGQEAFCGSEDRLYYTNKNPECSL